MLYSLPSLYLNCLMSMGRSKKRWGMGGWGRERD